jgi:hypothetical protein
MGDLLGGGGSEQESKNLAYPWIKDNFGTTGAGAFNAGTGMVGNILGLGGDPAAGKAALNQWWDSSGGNFLMDKGVDDITAKMAKLGLTKSGAAMKGLEDYRQGLASTKLNEILQNYMGLGKMGLSAGDLVANAGQVSKGSSGGGGGLGSLLGAAMAFI